MTDSQVDADFYHESVSHTSSNPVLPGADVVPDVTIPSADANDGTVGDAGITTESSDVPLDTESVLTSPFAADPAPEFTPVERAAQRKQANHAALEHLLYQVYGLDRPEAGAIFLRYSGIATFRKATADTIVSIAKEDGTPCFSLAEAEDLASLADYADGYAKSLGPAFTSSLWLHMTNSG